MKREFIPFKEEDIEKERFYKMPKAFIEDEYYRLQLNSNMKMIYALLWDRYKLSVKNNWKDSEGTIFCNYSRENIARDLNISVSTVTNSIKELTKIGLMKEVRRGLNKSNMMYISQVSKGLVKNETLNNENILESDTELRETKDQVIKRYTITSNGDPFLNYYNYVYNSIKGKDHPTVTKEQLNDISIQLDAVANENDINEEEMKSIIREHLDNLSEGNDGKIFAFLGSSENVSPIIRYRDDLENGGFE